MGTSCWEAEEEDEEDELEEEEEEEENDDDEEDARAAARGSALRSSFGISSSECDDSAQLNSAWEAARMLSSEERGW